MAVGDVPYKADTPMAIVFKHVHDPLPLPKQRVPGFPEQVERVILKALAKNPGDRFSTADQLVSALQSATDISPSMPTNEPPPEISEINETDNKKIF